MCISEIELGIKLILKISQIGGKVMKDVKPLSKEEKDGFKILLYMFLGSICFLLFLKFVFPF